MFDDTDSELMQTLHSTPANLLTDEVKPVVDGSQELRPETDSMGTLMVPSDRYWGAQTQRSLQNFKIGGQRMPKSLIHSLAVAKHAAATANEQLGKLDPKLASAIREAAQEVRPRSNELDPKGCKASKSLYVRFPTWCHVM